MEERTLPRYPAGKRELIFGLLVLLFGTFTWNSILYGGFCLGFALGAVALTGCSFWYLLRCGFRPGKYEAALLILAAAIFAGFARSSDGDMKAGMLLMALFAVNLSFCRMAGQSRREPGGIASALDAPRALFTLGVGSMSAAVRGLNDARKNAGTAGKRGGAAILGVLIALPVAAVLIVLLMRADAAFDLGVLAKCLRDYGIAWKQEAAYLCTCQMGRTCLPDAPNHKLNTLCALLHIPLDHHDAGSDSRACAALLQHYLARGWDPARYLRRYDVAARRTLPQRPGKALAFPPAACQALQRLRERGHSAYFVGGCVRDALRGQTPADFDLATSATPAEVAACFDRVIATGLQHGTAVLRWRSRPTGWRGPTLTAATPTPSGSPGISLRTWPGGTLPSTPWPTRRARGCWTPLAGSRTWPGASSAASATRCGG